MNVRVAHEFLANSVIHKQVEGHERVEYELYPIGRSKHIRNSAFCSHKRVCFNMLSLPQPIYNIYIDPFGQVWSCSLMSYLLGTIDTFEIDQYYHFLDTQFNQFLQESTYKSCLDCLIYFKGE